LTLPLLLPVVSPHVLAQHRLFFRKESGAWQGEEVLAVVGLMLQPIELQETEAAE
jgi:hypothetical protein